MKYNTIRVFCSKSSLGLQLSILVVFTCIFTGVTNKLQLFFYDTPHKIYVDHQIHQLFSPKLHHHIKGAAPQPRKTNNFAGPPGLQGPGARGKKNKTLMRLLVRPFKNTLFITAVLGYYNQFSCSDQ